MSTCDFDPLEAEAEGWKLETSLGYMVRTCLKTKQQEKNVLKILFRD